jgi:hypothetical protein
MVLAATVSPASFLRPLLMSAAWCCLSLFVLQTFPTL